MVSAIADESKVPWVEIIESAGNTFITVSNDCAGNIIILPSVKINKREKCNNNFTKKN